MREMFFGLMFLTGGFVTAEERPARDARAVEEAVAVQVLLDRANFGPGKIDGHLGDFTKKALERYRRSKAGTGSQSAPVAAAREEGASPAGTVTSTKAAAASGISGDSRSESVSQSPTATTELPQSAPLKEDSRRKTDSAGGIRAKETPEPKGSELNRAQTAAKEDISDLDLKSVEPVFVEYTVTEADVQSVGNLPATPREKATLKWLPYASVAEAVAERFHMDADFLEELNPGKGKKLRAGDVVRVPNVEPFDLNSVKDMKPGTPLNAKAANVEGPSDGEGETAASEKESSSAAETGKKEREAAATAKKGEDPDTAPALAVVINKDENMLDVFDGQRLIAAFPVTVGSTETASPVGEWKVRGVAKLPEFRWDEKMLKEGERSSDFHLLPPGPNSPVGVIWIALNRKGVGIHGSDNPDAIGRNVSHGCIRLANWDVVKLASMVKTGVPVSIR